MFGSGVPTAEKPQAKKFYLMTFATNAQEDQLHAWRSYKAYLERTSILIPIPPVVYQRLPAFLKKTILLDFPMYRFDEERDGPGALEEAKNKPS